MSIPAPAALLASATRPLLDPQQLYASLEASLGIAVCLLACAFFAILRVALLRSNAARVLARVPSQGRKQRLEPLIARADSLATSARVLEVACELAFFGLLLRALAGSEPVSLSTWLYAVLLAVPSLLVVTETLSTAIAMRVGDALLVRVLPAFDLVQAPLHWLVRLLEMIRRALMRVAGLRPGLIEAREIVEDLREVIEDSEISGGLDETEKEIIGNVMEFRDVGVSAVMTPRTEIHGVEIGAGVLAAAREFAACGHSRIPVYDGSLDTIVGVVTARDVVQLVGEKGLGDAALRSILRPATFVPETKRVSELLSEFKREKIKLAIVLDEYGGTAGLVTLGDIISEIVGDIQDEYDEALPQPIRRIEGGAAEVDASLHVSEVNEELAVEIPEGEDYETLAGFVLAELGHFPKRGERFELSGVEYVVLEASDRRVLKVCVRPMRRRQPA
jgi:putative hemolysin